MTTGKRLRDKRRVGPLFPRHRKLCYYRARRPPRLPLSNAGVNRSTSEEPPRLLIGAPATALLFSSFPRCCHIFRWAKAEHGGHSRAAVTIACAAMSRLFAGVPVDVRPLSCENCLRDVGFGRYVDGAQLFEI